MKTILKAAIRFTRMNRFEIGILCVKAVAAGLIAVVVLDFILSL